MNYKLFCKSMWGDVKRAMKATDWKASYLKTISEIEPQRNKLDNAERFFINTLKKQIENEVAVSSYQVRGLSQIWKRVVA